MSDLESDGVERKRSAGDRSAIRRNICAFANDLPGDGRAGVIFVGVEDDGRCSGATVNDQLLRLLAGMRNDGNILPLPSITVRRRVLGGCEVAVVDVQPSQDTPVRYQGRVWVRSDQPPARRPLRKNSAWPNGAGLVIFLSICALRPIRQSMTSISTT